jgi:hypothetical protein
LLEYTDDDRRSNPDSTKVQVASGKV